MKKVLTLLLKIITPITPPIVLTIALRIYHFIFPNRTSRSVRNDELLLEIQELFPNETLAGDKSGHIATTKHDSIYRGSKYIVFEGVVCPAHNTNFRYLGYLIKNVVREGDDVLDMCAGAGAVGFPLLKESGVRSVHFADLNFQAIRSIKATISENKLDGIKWTLSINFGT